MRRGSGERPSGPPVPGSPTRSGSGGSTSKLSLMSKMSRQKSQNKDNTGSALEPSQSHSSGDSSSSGPSAIPYESMPSQTKPIHVHHLPAHDSKRPEAQFSPQKPISGPIPPLPSRKHSHPVARVPVGRAPDPRADPRADYGDPRDSRVSYRDPNRTPDLSKGSPRFDPRGFDRQDNPYAHPEGKRQASDSSQATASSQLPDGRRQTSGSSRMSVFSMDDDSSINLGRKGSKGSGSDELILEPPKDEKVIEQMFLELMVSFNEHG